MINISQGHDHAIEKFKLVKATILNKPILIKHHEKWGSQEISLEKTLNKAHTVMQPKTFELMQFE